MIKKKKSRSQVGKFVDVLKELGYVSVGEFMELVGGIAALVAAGEIETAQKLAEPFSEQCGYIIEKIGHLDYVKARNEQLKNDEAALEEANKKQLTFQLDSSIRKTVKEMVEKDKNV